MKYLRLITLSIFFGLHFFLSATSLSFADEIILKNGDKISGTIQKLIDGVLTISTKYSKEIKIDFAEIRRLKSDSLVKLGLKNGWIVKGKVQAAPDGMLAIRSGKGKKEAMVDWEEIESINKPKKEEKRWAGNVNLGATHQSGNVERVTAAFGAEGELDLDRDKFAAKFIPLYADDDGNVTTRNTSGNVSFKHFFDSKVYGAINFDGYKDKFRNLNLRYSIGPGIGYQVWDEAKRKLSFETGITYFSEDLKTGEDKQYATARAASDFEYQITENTRITNRFVIFPNLDSVGDYILRNEAGLKNDIGAGWGLKFSHIFDYNNNPSAGIKKGDSYTILGLQYDY
jgi:putative salt-induced outer membrane protein YdiY